MKKVTIIVPCYNESASLPILSAALQQLMDSQTAYEWEVLFVNDGSHDLTLEMIKSLREADKRFCYIDLSRNFGKENAMLAGLDYATGDCAVIMDADMQHPPTLVPTMLAKWEEGYDDVYARRTFRERESWMRRTLTRVYYKLLQRTTRFDILPNVGDFRLLDRKCVDALKQLRETQRYTKGLFCWIGFRKIEVEFEHHDRAAGKSTFSYSQLFNLALDGITSYTTAPLRISTVMGIVISILAFFYMIFIVVKALIIGEPVQGFPTLMTAILLLGGLQLFSLGIIGEYLGRIFHETKNRPVYIAREVVL